MFTVHSNIWYICVLFSLNNTELSFIMLIVFVNTWLSYSIIIITRLPIKHYLMHAAGGDVAINSMYLYPSFWCKIIVKSINLLIEWLPLISLLFAMFWGDGSSSFFALYCIFFVCEFSLRLLVGDVEGEGFCYVVVIACWQIRR